MGMGKYVSWRFRATGSSPPRPCAGKLRADPLAKLEPSDGLEGGVSCGVFASC